MGKIKIHIPSLEEVLNLRSYAFNIDRSCDRYSAVTILLLSQESKRYTLDNILNHVAAANHIDTVNREFGIELIVAEICINIPTDGISSLR